MPELPEVETTLRGIKPYLLNNTIQDIVVRNPSLRWPVPVEQLSLLKGCIVSSLSRRAKYVLIHTQNGSLILHLGMSGSVRIVDSSLEPGKHDHVDIVLNSGKSIRFNDPRRFGCLLFSSSDPLKHQLINHLGPEPLSDEFDAEYLYKQSRNRSVAVKNFIMDGKVVVGVGNIYASESLFLSGIRPTIAANKISKPRYEKLVASIKQVLSKAIESGGTSLRDFTQSDGKPGYFGQELRVYGKEGDPCPRCGAKIKQIVIGQRSSFYCAKCQR